MNHARAVACRPDTEFANRVAIDPHREIRFVLSPVDSVVSSGVDDDIRPGSLEQSGERRRRRQVDTFALAPGNEQAIPCGRDNGAHRVEASLLEERLPKLSIGT